LSIGRPARKAASISPTSARPSATLSSDPLSEGDAVHSSGSGLRVGSYVAFGVSALALGAGAYFLVKSGSTRDDATKLFNTCINAPVCSDSAQAQIHSKDNEADSQRNVGIGGLIVGGVAAATGVTLLILGSQHSAATAKSGAPRVTPVFGFRSLGLVGTF